MKNTLFIIISAFCLLFLSCKGNDPIITKKSLTVSRDSLVYVIEGGRDTLTINTNSSKWRIKSTADWAKVSVDSSVDTKKQITVIIAANPIKELRTAKLIIVGVNTDTVFVKITQITKSSNGTDYPDYSDSIAADMTGMSSTAAQIASAIKVGINIGNTLEAIGGETAWGNPLITNDLIKSIKLNGFKSIRLPCSWNQFSNQSTAKINDSWLNRVKQVVQYCVDNNMYVIVNIHWDGGWLENNCTLAKKDVNNAKQRAFWEQIAVKLRDFDEHVLFASANEPNASDATQMGVLLSYHQTFIDTVRSTGGKNAYRVLVVQGPNTDIATTNKLFTKLPTDKVPNRMMAEVHYYTPWNFCGMTKDETWGNQFYYWGANYHSTTDTAHNPTWGEEAEVDKLFALMKNQFVYKGIPVIIGEFGASRRDNLTGDALKLHLASRAYLFKYIVKQAKANGMLPFFWDTGGMIDRRNYTILDQQALDGLIQGANGL
jgi:endoglucanase